MEAKVYKVKGLTCNHCKDRVETHLLRLNHIKKVDVDIAKNEIAIKGEKIYDEFVKKVVDGLGYSFVGEIN